MSSTQPSNDAATKAPGTKTVPMRLEVLVLPVADVDRAKSFYERLGWRLNVDAGAGSYRVVQMTPPGSTASITFGSGVTPGSIDSVLLAVDDIEAARAELRSRGADVSEVFHDPGGGLGGGWRPGTESRAAGHDPQGRSYASYASFQDPDPACPVVCLSDDHVARVTKQACDGFTDLPHVIDQHHAQHASASAFPAEVARIEVRRGDPAIVGLSLQASLALGLRSQHPRTRNSAKLRGARAAKYGPWTSTETSPSCAERNVIARLRP